MYELNEEHTFFITDRELHKAMPFSLKNAGVTYQRLVNGSKDLIEKSMEVNMDDMLVKPKIAGDHIEHIN